MRNNLNRRGEVLAVALLLSLSTLPLEAHHATAAFDRDQSVSVSGIVLRWQFINPHSGIWIEVLDDAGVPTEWVGEFQGTLDLYRHFNWNKDTFAAGDHVTLTGYPARNGDSSMSVRIVGFEDGREVDVRSAPD